ATSQKSLDLRPSAEAHSNIGTMEYARGNYADAARHYEKAVELKPGRHLLWGNLADAAVMVPELRPKAAEAYRQALRIADRELTLNPRDADLHACVATYLEGLGDHARALSEVEMARQLVPASLNYLFLAALVNEGAGRRQDALRLLEEAARKGYAPIEIQRHPQLAKLRADPGYRPIQNLLDAPGQAAKKAG